MARRREAIAYQKARPIPVGRNTHGKRESLTYHPGSSSSSLLCRVNGELNVDKAETACYHRQYNKRSANDKPVRIALGNAVEHLEEANTVTRMPHRGCSAWWDTGLFLSVVPA